VGDLAFFSFNYDKPITLGWGGALVAAYRDLPQPTKFDQLDSEVEFAIVRSLDAWYRQRRSQVGIRASLLRSRAAWRRVAERKSSKPHYRPVLSDSRIGIGPVRARLGLLQIERYGKTMKWRNDNARKLSELVGRDKMWHVDSDVKPAWLKAKVFTSSPYSARLISKRAQSSGFRVGIFNWPTVTEHAHPEVNPWSQLITLQSLDAPIHQNMKLRDVIRLAQTLKAGPLL